MSLTVVVEGDTDLPIVAKLAADAGIMISREIGCAGKSQLDADLRGYNNAAHHAPWFVLRDLDQDAACAGELLAGWAFQPSNWMCFRLAVRAIESWLLADHEGICSFFKVKPSIVPEHPDTAVNPTQALVNLARRSRSKRIRDAMVPRPGLATSVGAFYEATIIHFGRDHWDLDRAAARSESLARARHRLHELARRWRSLVGDAA
ncbi:MAG: hypothetical protein HC897_07995 [Thermoanaerobaculia bacterium]|nr:hypothetical protein [Thermoanaerobaculia bacterium]